MSSIIDEDCEGYDSEEEVKVPHWKKMEILNGLRVLLETQFPVSCDFIIAYSEIPPDRTKKQKILKVSDRKEKVIMARKKNTVFLCVECSVEKLELGDNSTVCFPCFIQKALKRTGVRFIEFERREDMGEYKRLNGDCL